MKQQITDAYTEIEKARRQMRGLSKACAAFGNLLGEEESWSLVGKAAMDCDEAMSKAQGKLDEMKAQIYGSKASLGKKKGKKQEARWVPTAPTVVGISPARSCGT